MMGTHNYLDFIVRIFQQTMVRARELELQELEERAREEELRKLREQDEQEKRFYQKLNIERQWKKIQAKYYECFCKNGPIQAFFHLFSSFQTNITIFTTNIRKNCPSSILRWYSNPRPLRHESPYITTRQVFVGNLDFPKSRKKYQNWCQNLRKMQSNRFCS